MFITKRDGKKQKFDAVKIKDALAAAFRSVEHAVTDAELDALTDAVIAKIEACCEIAPLHNPANLQGIRAVSHASTTVRV